MADKKAKNPRFTTPLGIAAWPRVTVADTQFVKTGEWSTKITFAPDDPGVSEFLAYLDAQVDAAVVEMKKQYPKAAKAIKPAPAYRNEVDKEGTETGRIEFGAKRPCQVTRKADEKVFKLNPPVLFDSAGNVIKKDIKLGAGSKILVNFEHYPYIIQKDKEVGISRRLLAVQVIELVEWNGVSQDAETYGFGAVDGGFEVSGAMDGEVSENEAGSSTDDADEF